MFRTAPHCSPGQIRGTRRLGVVGRFVALVAIGSTTVLSTGCASDQSVIQQASQFHGELDKAVVRDPELATYIQTVGDRIVETAERLHSQGYRPSNKADEASDWMFSDAMQFHFVNSDTLNAFTTGGEHMYVYTELLRQSRTEPEMAAVVAHEYGHVYGRHIHNGMNRQIAVMLGAGAAAAAGYAAGGSDHGGEYAGYGAGLGMLLGGLATAGFSREDETEADKIGFDFYVRSGYDPDQFAGFFRTILEQEAKAGGGGPEFLRTHPATATRITNAERWAEEWKQLHPDWRQRLRPPVADQQEFRRLQQRSVEVGRNMPSDKSLDQKALLQALPRSCILPDEPRPPEVQQAQQYLERRVQEEPQQQPQPRRRQRR